MHVIKSTVRSCSDVGLPRAAVLGVLGGGQLGKMLAMEAVSAPLSGVTLPKTFVKQQDG